MNTIVVADRKLSDEVQAESNSVLKHELTQVELNLYVYLDYCWKHGGRLDNKKLNEEQRHIINVLISEDLIVRGSNNMCYPTEDFYDLVQKLLWITHVNKIKFTDE